MGLISNGTTAFDAGSMSLGGQITFIKKLTASGDSTLSFVHGSSSVVFDGTYKEYLITLKHIHPATNNVAFEMNFTQDGSSFAQSKTTTNFDAYHAEAGNDSGLRIEGNPNSMLANNTGWAPLNYNMGNENDGNLSGFVRIFNPADTTFVKHFQTEISFQYLNTYAIRQNTGGYVNASVATVGVGFRFSSGNIDAGDICLYGIG
tara:strand:+ start:608 stop:1219 length:612 start_codon:yes stop_codon:yes gene_type:complete